MIKIKRMEQSEIEMFKKYLGGDTGTIIEFPHCDDLQDVIKKNFRIYEESEDENLQNLNDMIYFVFGSFDIIGYIGLYASAGIALWSMVVYLRQAWPEMRGDESAESE